MVRHDAEIAADIGNHGADPLAADFGGDLLRRGQVAVGLGSVCLGRARQPVAGRAVSVPMDMRGVAGFPVSGRAAARKELGLERIGTKQGDGDA